MRTSFGWTVAWLVSCAVRGPATPPAPPPPPLPEQQPPAPPAAVPNLEGVWRGVLAGTLRLALSVTRAGDSYNAVLDSIDQGSTLPVDRITVEGDTLRFDIALVHGSFAGKIGANR